MTVVDQLPARSVAEQALMSEWLGRAIHHLQDASSAPSERHP